MSRWDRILNAAQRIADRILLGPAANTPRLPFRPTWDERRLDHIHVIDRDLGVLDKAFPEHDQ